jgi:hypothetical protein
MDGLACVRVARGTGAAPAAAPRMAAVLVKGPHRILVISLRTAPDGATKGS